MNFDEDLLQQIADLHSTPQGAYNIRKNGKLVNRNCSANIEINTKTDKSGIDIKIKDNTKNESVHIPVIITETGLTDIVYNDFYIGKNCNVVIIAGCGIHNDGNDISQHDGIHTFYVGENSTIKYIEKHLGNGINKKGQILNPNTILHLQKGSKVQLETIQLGGVTSSIRSTSAYLAENSALDITERILTEDEQRAETIFNVELNGPKSKVNVVSRSVAKGNSEQIFVSNINGNNESFGHVECDAIILDNAKVRSTPALANSHPDATLTHEAAIGKIAGEQITKLQTLGLTSEEAEQLIIRGFLK